MPNWLQYVDFSIGLIGLFLTLYTLKTAFSVKRYVIRNAEISDFSNEFPSLINQLDGYIYSIIEDKIYESDNGRSFRPSIIHFLDDASTRYSFFSSASKRKLKELRRLLNNPTISNDEWIGISSQLTALKNLLRKELVYHE